MYVNIFVNICIYIYICICIYICAYIPFYLYIYMYMFRDIYIPIMCISCFTNLLFFSILFLYVLSRASASPRYPRSASKASGGSSRAKSK